MTLKKSLNFLLPSWLNQLQLYTTKYPPLSSIPDSGSRSPSLQSQKCSRLVARTTSDLFQELSFAAKSMNLSWLIRLLHFIHSSLDLKQPHAVLAAFIDMSKAFDTVPLTSLTENLQAHKYQEMASQLSHRKTRIH